MNRRRIDRTTTASTRRAPLPAAIPRPAKRASTRNSPWRVIGHVRVIGVSLDDDQRAYISKKLGMKLGKFASSIERVTVRVTDVNGPRGGVDQRCRVKVVLIGLPSVIVERRHAATEAAIDAALRAAEESVRRAVGRRRMKPLHRPDAKRESARQRRQVIGGAADPRRNATPLKSAIRVSR